MHSSSSEAFRSLLPAHVALSCTSQFVDAAALSVGEEEYLQNATVERRQEFCTGRTCALAALEELGISLPSIGRNGDRTPNWPAGTVGSITHCKNLCAAAVSPMSATRCLGIDAEVNEPLSLDLLERISSHAEQQELRSAQRHAGALRFTGRTLFSAKESAYKALFPIVGIHFGFEDVELRLDVDDGNFRLVLSQTLQDLAGLECLVGRYTTTPSHTITAIHLDAYTKM